jgi:hypothetical protein
MTPLSLLKAIRQHSIQKGEVDEHSHDIAEGISSSSSKEAFKYFGPDCNHIMLRRVQQLSKKKRHTASGGFDVRVMSTKQRSHIW